MGVYLKRALVALAVMLGVFIAPALADVPSQPPTPGAADQPAAPHDYSWIDRLPHQTGSIAIAEAKARLNLGDGYYFLGPADAKRVLTEGWGNPPDEVNDVLGMIFPKGGDATNSWGAVVTYDDSGYVKDDDAAKIDPDDLLKQMREGEDERNRQLKTQGFDALHVAGWAEPPSYDVASHSAIWARDLEILGTGHHSLNYQIRILGRRGVLSLNIVAPLDRLAEVKAVSAQVRSLAAYDVGSRYADVDKANDKMAAYGVAGMIAAGVGVAAAKKLGLLAVLLLFAKKGFVLIAAGFAAVAAWFRRLFGGKKLQVAKPAAYTPPPASSFAPPPASPPPPPPPPSDIVQ